MLDGALCALAMVALMQSLRALGARSVVLLDAAGAGAAVILAFGMVHGFESAIVAVAIGVAALLMPRPRAATPVVVQSALVLGVLASACLNRSLGLDAASPWQMAGGGSLVLVAFVAFVQVRFSLSSATLASSMCFACAGLCTVIAFVSGVDGGALSVVMVCAMAALIGAFVAMAIAYDSWPAFVSLLNAYAGCSVVALGVGLDNGILMVTGVALAVGCLATCSRFSPAQARLGK
jgi:NAD/NADP transhydrogenase beta subunit